MNKFFYATITCQNTEKYHKASAFRHNLFGMISIYCVIGETKFTFKLLLAQQAGHLLLHVFHAAPPNGTRRAHGRLHEMWPEKHTKGTFLHERDIQM